jgi:uncharacterized protein (TIGR02266 family)
MRSNLKVLISHELEPFFAHDEQFVHREGFELLIAEDGRQAWDMFRGQEPDLAILDLNVPDMPGDEFCCRVHKHPQLRHIPVVLVVQAHHQEELTRCLRARCADLLFKPLNDHLLLATTRRILGLAYRSFPRVAACMPVRYSRDREKFHSGSIFNLSSGGLFLETERLFPLEERLFLEFSLPDRSEPLTCQAGVAWVNERHQPVNSRMPTGMGLQFLNLGLPDLLAICHFLREQSEPGNELY